MRLYAPIWNEIKSKHMCKISAPKPMHKRIKKGVVKEKDADTGFKYEMQEQHKRATLKIEINNNVITFTLCITTDPSFI